MSNSLSFLRASAAALAFLAAPAAMAEDTPFFDLGNMTPEQEVAFGEAVRAYLLDNPQVIMDAVAVLEQREKEAQVQQDLALVANNKDRLLNDGYSWVGGNPEGDVTIIEFMDYRCGYCRKAQPEVDDLIALDGNIRLIVKEFPILGDDSMVSARFAIATQIVAGDDAYKAVHDALIALEGKPGKGPLRRLAETLGLDADAIMAEMDSEEVARRIADTRDLALSMNISGTPTFVFGDQMVRGYAPLPTMQQIVAEARAAN